VTGLASPGERWLALHLLEGASDADLKRMFDPRWGLLRQLDQAIPAGDELRPDLDDFLQRRFRGGRARLEQGRVRPHGQPAARFTPALLDKSLVDLPLDRELNEDELRRVADVTSELDEELSELLMPLPRVQRARATRWLTGVWVALHARGAGREDMRALDYTLNVLYGEAAADVADAGRLRLVTMTPSAELAKALRGALDPAPSDVGGPPEPFTRQLPDQDDFETQLREAYRSDIRNYAQDFVAGRAAGHREPDRLYSMEHIGRIAQKARDWVGEVFGRLVSIPALRADPDGLPGRGRIHDHWEYVGQLLASLDETKQKAPARDELIRYLTREGEVAGVLGKHHAVPDFAREDGTPNEPAEIISRVIEGLLGDRPTVAQVLDIYRHFPGSAEPATGEVWIQRFRMSEPRENQQELWRKVPALIHETTHLLEHWRFRSYVLSLGEGAPARDALTEGMASLLTEIVWPRVSPQEPAVREVIEGEYSGEEELPEDLMPQAMDVRYPSMAQVMRLVHLLGSPLNVLAAFLLGDVEKITGLSEAAMGLPRAPLSAAEVAEHVNRLNAVPAAQPLRTPISLFAIPTVTSAAQQAQAHLSGDPDATLDARRLRWVVEAMVAGPASGRERALALVLLQTADDAALGQMFADGGLARVLDAGFPSGEAASDRLRADLERFYQRRFGVGQAAVAAGGRGPLEVFAPAEFSPGLIAPGLAHLPVGAELTSEQAREAMSGRSSAELTELLEKLPPVQRLRAAWWVARAREATGWADQARAYLSGDPEARLTASQQRDLVVRLLTRMASRDERRLALIVLRAAHDVDLGSIVKAAGGLLPLLEEAIPAGDGLRPELESFLRDRFGERWGELGAGLGMPHGQPAGMFIPALLDGSLMTVPLVGELGGGALGLVETAVSRLSSQELTEKLMPLPPVERARATRWLTGVRVGLHARGAGREVMATVDSTLDVLYRAAVREIRDPDWLRLVTLRPPAGREKALRAALDPPPPTQPFTSQLPGKGDFRSRLSDAFRDALTDLTQIRVDGRRAENRTPASLYPMEHIGQIAAQAKKWTDRLFGHLATKAALEADRNIHDQWEDADQDIAAMSDREKRTLAGQQLGRYLTWNNRVVEVMREHHAVVLFDRQGKPLNNETQIISEVISGLLDEDKDEAILTQVLDIYRGLPGRARPWTMEVWVQAFRAPERWQNQQALWGIAATLVHEYLHLLEHPRYQSYRDSLMFGTDAFNTLVEGVVSLLTEVVWPGVRPGGPAVRAKVEREYSSDAPLSPDRMPHPAETRYPSLAQVMRLVHELGDVRNLFAAFFLGDIEKITGPLGGAATGSPRAALSAEDVAELVARLNALPAAEPQGPPVSLFDGAPPELIEELLTDEPRPQASGDHPAVAAGRVVAPFPGEPDADTGSGAFAAAVDQLAEQLYPGQDLPVPLHEVMGYLRAQGLVQEVPTADELPAVIAGFYDIPVHRVDRAAVDQALDDLAHRVAQARQAGHGRSALPGGRSSPPWPPPARLKPRAARFKPPAAQPGPAGPAAIGMPALPGLVAGPARRRGDAERTGRAAPGEFDAGSFDKAWGKLPDSERTARAVARAQQLIGRLEPVIGVRTQTPIADLDPLGQAIRWLAVQLYRNPDDQVTAEALARDLAVRLAEVLGQPGEGRLPGGSRKPSEPESAGAAGSLARPDVGAMAEGSGSSAGRGPGSRPGVVRGPRLASPELAAGDAEPVRGIVVSPGSGAESAERLRRQLEVPAGRAGDAAQRAARELRSRALAVLGGRQDFSDDQVSVVMAVADRLAAGGRADAAWFEELGRAAGLPGDGVVSRRRVFGLLELAAGVFGADGVLVAQLAGLRVLADLVQGPGRDAQPVTAADLAGLFRSLHDRPAGAVVTAGEVRDLVGLAGEAQEVAGAGRLVGLEDLAAMTAGRTGVSRRLSDVVAEEDWWQLWIAQPDHTEALERFPGDPGRLYDSQQAPGFRQAMLRAFREVLDPAGRRYPRLDANGYKLLHELVTPAGMESQWSGAGTDEATEFDVSAVSSEMFTDTVQGHALVAFEGSAGLPITLLRSHDDGSPYLTTNYPDVVAALLAGAALDSYYQEVSEAADGDGRLLAIARLIRRLHVMHLFTDANGRVNIYLLLPRLLLEHGFRPVIHPELSQMFSGGWYLDEIVAMLRDGQNQAIPRQEAAMAARVDDAKSVPR
jgi:hypothetical protein